MNKLVYFKVFVLIAILAMVFYVMTHLSPDKVAQGMEHVGLTPGTNGTINLCRTRVHAITWPDGRKIQEATEGIKAKWQAYNLDPVDIGSMDVEKWLSLHCQLPVSFRDASASAGAPAEVFKPYVSIVYIDSTREDLERSDDGTYRFTGKTFTSEDLDSAMSELISLANLQPQGP